ncbi:hypothetical protein LINGRAHAP2_LOCUS33941, partial [Linum grandiflorum]
MYSLRGCVSFPGLTSSSFIWLLPMWYFNSSLFLSFLISSSVMQQCTTASQQQIQMVSWCSWLSRQSNTLKVSGSNP